MQLGLDLGLTARPKGPREYHNALTAAVNLKGVVDVDTVKGCTAGMRAHPGGGCYGECYANRIAVRNGIAFNVSVSRYLVDQWSHRDLIVRQLLDQSSSWYRIGVMGDPCHDWNNTISVCRALRPARKTAVIVTKHWTPLSDDHLSKLLDLDVVVHTSMSGMDTDAELRHRVMQFERLGAARIPSIARIVTCSYGKSEWAQSCNEKQQRLLLLAPIIDNPLRPRLSNPHVANGDIIVTRRADSIGGGTLVSLHSSAAFLGHCSECPDQCGVVAANNHNEGREFMTQQTLFADAPKKKTKKVARAQAQAEFKHVKQVIGSGYESAVAALAIEDGIAHRAARKNMQIHSAIICLVGGEFAGFFTFQDNQEVGEFCLLQSVIHPDLYTPDLYLRMTEQVLACNTSNLPALMTTNPKSKFETPALFEKLGFETYLKMGGFHYMLAGNQEYNRMKLLSHITMTNAWNSTKGDWLRLKRVWNEHLDMAGAKQNIPNPAYATRDGCWQGTQGFANVVTGRSHNGNASVLDPVACEVILRFFTPDGGRVYNPFGGGVQFGYVAGASGYKYLASEIRKNQCDANNALCSEFNDVRWVQSDSSTYEPDGMYDLIFTCPPYYHVEKYLDYDGKPPAGEINSLPTYEVFRDTLFSGYSKAIEHLGDNRFFVVMTGDSRDKTGAYYCHEAETEIFLKDRGLSVYNKIVYLEAEFTRLAQAKKTLNMRKFPKREQKIIVAYKGKVDLIKDEFPPIGRL